MHSPLKVEYLLQTDYIRGRGKGPLGEMAFGIRGKWTSGAKVYYHGEEI